MKAKSSTVFHFDIDLITTIIVFLNLNLGDFLAVEQHEIT